jgi:Spy/CpxP family protein refolding chaperone
MDQLKEKMNNIRMETREAMNQLMQPTENDKQTGNDVREKVKELKMAEREKMTNVRKEISELRQQMDTIRSENMKDFENLLTAEQKDKFQSIKEERKNHHEEMKKHHEEMRKHHEEALQNNTDLQNKTDAETNK